MGQLALSNLWCLKSPPADVNKCICSNKGTQRNLGLKTTQNLHETIRINQNNVFANYKRAENELKVKVVAKMN